MDRQIIKNILMGNKDEFSNIIDKYQKMIYSICYKIFNNKSDAEDMTQETFMKIYKNLYKCEDNENIKTWIYTLAYNICIDEIRKRNTKKKISSSVGNFEDETSIVLEKDLCSPEKLFLDKEGLMVIEKAINKLNAVNRVIVFLRDIQGFSHAEISEITGINIGTVKSRLNRAHKQLKENLKL